MTPGDRTSQKLGVGYCELVFGDDWKVCVSPKGRRELCRRIEQEELVVYEPKDQWANQDEPPGGIRHSQIQYQLLTAKLAIGSSYDSADEAPDGVNEALEHIQNAMTILGDQR